MLSTEENKLPVWQSSAQGSGIITCIENNIRNRKKTVRERTGGEKSHERMAHTYHIIIIIYLVTKYLPTYITYYIM